MGIKSIEISAGFSATFRTTSKTTGNFADTVYPYYGIDGFVGNRNCSINGNTILCTQDSLIDIMQTSTKLEITFDNINPPTKIVRFSLEKTEIHPNNTSSTISSLAGENVPFGGSPWGDPPNQTTYWYDGDFSQYITNLTQVIDQPFWTDEIISYDATNGGLYVWIIYDE